MTTTRGEAELAVHPENCTGCLSCQLSCSFAFHDEFNPAKAYICINWVNYQPEITFTEDCTMCLICAQACPYGALEVVGGA